MAPSPELAGRRSRLEKNLPRAFIGKKQVRQDSPCDISRLNDHPKLDILEWLWTLQNSFVCAQSTDVEDKQILSIEAQLVELREYAAREKLFIVEELIEKQSAKIPGRPSLMP